MFYINLLKNYYGLFYLVVYVMDELKRDFIGDLYLLYDSNLLSSLVSLKGMNKLVACIVHDKTLSNYYLGRYMIPVA